MEDNYKFSFEKYLNEHGLHVEETPEKGRHIICDKDILMSMSASIHKETMLVQMSRWWKQHHRVTSFHICAFWRWSQQNVFLLLENQVKSGSMLQMQVRSLLLRGVSEAWLVSNMIWGSSLSVGQIISWNARVWLPLLYLTGSIGLVWIAQSSISYSVVTVTIGSSIMSRQEGLHLQESWWEHKIGRPSTRYLWGCHSSGFSYGYGSTLSDSWVEGITPDEEAQYQNTCMVHYLARCLKDLVGQKTGQQRRMEWRSWTWNESIPSRREHDHSNSSNSMQFIHHSRSSATNTRPRYPFKVDDEGWSRSVPGL